MVALKSAIMLFFLPSHNVVSKPELGNYLFEETYLIGAVFVVVEL